MMVSSCGLICNECEFFGNKCKGCQAVKVHTFWAKEMMPTKTCPLYDCAANQKCYKDCGECSELPCNTFVTMKDPNSTDEEHKQSIRTRVAVLKGK